MTSEMEAKLSVTASGWRRRDRGYMSLYQRQKTPQ